MHRFYITTALVAAMFLVGCGDSNDDNKQSDRGPISPDYGQPQGIRLKHPSCRRPAILVMPQPQICRLVTRI